MHLLALEQNYSHAKQLMLNVTVIQYTWLLCTYYSLFFLSYSLISSSTYLVEVLSVLAIYNSFYSQSLQQVNGLAIYYLPLQVAAAMRRKSKEATGKSRSNPNHHRLVNEKPRRYVFSMYLTVFSMFFQCIWLCFQCIINVFSMYYQCIFDVFSMYFQCIYNVFSMYYQCIWLYFQCIYNVFSMYLTVFSMYFQCIFNVISMCYQCIIYVFSMY